MSRSPSGQSVTVNASVIGKLSRTMSRSPSGQNVTVNASVIGKLSITRTTLLGYWMFFFKRANYSNLGECFERITHYRWITEVNKTVTLVNFSLIHIFKLQCCRITMRHEAFVYIE